MNKQKGMEEKKKKAIEYRKQRNEEAKQNKINSFRKNYEGIAQKKGTKKDRAPA